MVLFLKSDKDTVFVCFFKNDTTIMIYSRTFVLDTNECVVVIYSQKFVPLHPEQLGSPLVH